jgi:hypothetical protein
MWVSAGWEMGRMGKRRGCGGPGGNGQRRTIEGFGRLTDGKADGLFVFSSAYDFGCLLSPVEVSTLHTSTFGA